MCNYLALLKFAKACDTVLKYSSFTVIFVLCGTPNTDKLIGFINVPKGNTGSIKGTLGGEALN